MNETKISMETIAVMQDLMTERVASHILRGKQQHSNSKWLQLTGEEFGEICQALQVDDPWHKESDKSHLYTEILHCANILIQWAESVRPEEEI